MSVHHRTSAGAGPGFRRGGGRALTATVRIRPDRRSQRDEEL